MKKLRKVLCAISVALLFSASAQAGSIYSYLYYDDAGNVVGGLDVADGCGDTDENGNLQTGYYASDHWGVWTSNQQLVLSGSC